MSQVRLSIWDHRVLLYQVEHNKSLQLSARWPFAKVFLSRAKSKRLDSVSGRQLNSMLAFTRADGVAA